MESLEEESREMHPSLPPNYVSLAQLREQWLQKQMQKDRMENQEQKQKQPGQEGKLIVAPQGQRSEKGKEKFHEKEQGRGRNGWRRGEGPQKVYVSKRVLGGNRPEIGGAERHLKSEELRARAPVDHGVDGVGGKEETIMGEKREKKKWNKRVARVNRSLIGVHQNQEDSGDLSWGNGGEEKCRREFGRNDTEDGEVKEKVSVSMVGVVMENKGKEVTSLGMGGKCGGARGFRKQDSGDSNDGRLGGSVNVCMVELLPENGSELEVPVAGNGVDQGMLEAEIVSVAKVLPETKVEEGCSVNVGRKNGKRRFRGRSQRNVDNLGKWRDSIDNKMELGCKKNGVEEGVLVKGNERNGVSMDSTMELACQKNVVEEGILVKENERNSISMDSKVELGCEKNVVDEGALVKENQRNAVQKRRTARGIQAYGDKKIVPGDLSTKVRRDLRSLSLDDYREENVTWRKGRHRWGRRSSEKSRDANRLVWVKKGEISDTNAANI